MISFRYHLVSLVAVLLALATGIALGSGPLRGSVSQRLAAAHDDARAQGTTASQAESGETEALAGFQDAFAESVATRLVPTSLQGRAVLLVRLPGTPARSVKALEQQVTRAGGTLTGVVKVRRKLLDPDQRQLAEGVSGQVLAQARATPPLAGLSSYELVGNAFGRAFLTDRAGGVPSDDTARTIETSLTEAGFLTPKAPVQRRAGLALVLTDAAEQQPVTGADDLFADFISAVDAVSSGVVVAGPPSAADPGGLVAAVRDGSAARSVSTVDTIDVTAGQVVAVLALVEQSRGRSGQYGISGAVDGAVPGFAKTR